MNYESLQAATSSTTDYEQLTYATATVGGSTVSTPLVSSQRLRDGNSISFSYDHLNRVTGKDLPGSELDVAYGYDLMGRIARRQLRSRRRHRQPHRLERQLRLDQSLRHKPELHRQRAQPV